MIASTLLAVLIMFGLPAAGACLLLRRQVVRERNAARRAAEAIRRQRETDLRALDWRMR